MTSRIIPLALLVLSIIGLIVVNDRHIWGNVGILWLVLSHLMFVFILYAGKLLLERD